jgi:hypothetical protein
VHIGVRACNTIAHQSAFRNGKRASKYSTAPLRSSVTTSRQSNVEQFAVGLDDAFA